MKLFHENFIQPKIIYAMRPFIIKTRDWNLLTHANLRKYFPAMWDDESLHHVRLSIASAVFHNSVWSVRALKSSLPLFFRSFQPPHCNVKWIFGVTIIVIIQKIFKFYLILLRAFSFSVIRRSNASSLASASLSLRSTSPALWKWTRTKSMKTQHFSFFAFIGFDVNNWMILSWNLQFVSNTR